MNISLVNQSLRLAKQLNHLKVNKEKNWIEKERKVQREREISDKKSRSSSVKKQVKHQINLKYQKQEHELLTRKTMHV